MAKTSILIQIEAEALQELERRAKRELLPVQELIAEILRRSAVMSRIRKSGSAIPQQEKEDPFIGYFSRVGGRPKKSGVQKDGI